MGDEKLDALSRLVSLDERQFQSKQRKKDSELEKIRKQLEQAALSAKEKYETKYREKLPEAEDKYRSIIKPWWLKIEESGLYGKLVSWRKGGLIDRFQVSDDIYFFWPRDVYREFARAREWGKKPFEWRSESVVKPLGRDGFPEQALARHLRDFEGEFWKADFRFADPKEFKGLDVLRWPIGGGGCGYSARRYPHRLGFEEDNALPDINPVVFIDFAGQIESGRVWEIIEEFINKQKKRK